MVKGEIGSNAVDAKNEMKEKRLNGNLGEYYKLETV